MNRDSINDQDTVSALELTIKIPAKLSKRVEAYAMETGNTVSGTVIEALDVFLREWKKRNG